VNWLASFRSIFSVAQKEFLHIVRDWRVLALILTLPPAFTLLFGYAFEVGEITDAPAVLRDEDHSEQSQKLVERLRTNKAFAWQEWDEAKSGQLDLLKARVLAVVKIPPGWGQGLSNGDPIPLRLILDGTDTNTAPQLEGAVQQALGTFQVDSRQDMIDQLPDEVFELGKKLPEDVRHQFSSSMTPWTVESEILYNPGLRFIDYVMPGIVGLILQLLTVTLMACTITRERESGTLAQLLVSPLRRGEIVVGKVLPYLVVSIFLICTTLATGHFHFHVAYRAPFLLSLLCLLFLLCSLGTGLLISAFCQTQAQAIQFAVFYLLPVFPLSGAFASLDQLPSGVSLLSEAFPLTHFCRAFRLVCLGQAGLPAIAGDLAFLFLGAIITCCGASLLLRRLQD
jgi:ABC-2 type transport system permease protein